MKTYLHGKRLDLTPWAAAAIGETDRQALTARAMELGVAISVGKVSGGTRSGKSGWTLRLYREGTPGPVLEWFYQKGPLAILLAHIMDAYTAEPFTPDELVTIAAQSGIAVSRA